MTRYFKKSTFTALLVLGGYFLQAQTVLNNYIQQGLDSNLVLKEKTISLEKGLIALKEARSLFLPTTWFQTQYTLAQGGRAINIPVGDLLNPVYKTLNQLTGTNSFPQISNVSEQFLPNNFYDVRVKTTMPIINTDLKYNRTIKQNQIQLQENEVDIYRRELVKEIKTAYYSFLLANQAIHIYETTLEVVNQNLKVNQSLLNNGKGLPAYVSRSESEVQQVQTELQNAQNAKQNAQAYFNFLLNKNFNDSIIIEELPLPAPEIQGISQDDVTKREELKSLELSKTINTNILKMNQSFRVPKLNAFLDLSAQGFNFKVNSSSFFYFGGIDLQIPLFTGKRNLYKIEQSKITLKSLDLTTQNTFQQLQLAAFVSRNNSRTAYSNYYASVKKRDAANQYFKLIDRGYREGVNSFIEWLDARNQVTTAHLQVTINHYKILSALADYERQTASYSFK